ncbi:hypothetical protein EVAR_83497_1 [Eumeta japonica]|uniref:Reverse transcriptase domain-containing protein n=1 Tax=Eumeta variegata TaxID=151549 RepID=A0A4C1Y2Z7_EUMVA|nr:hypothetical protein EVAR_83497_1 [Eumeta japonica]
MRIGRVFGLRVRSEYLMATVGFTKGRSTTEAGVELIQQIFGAWEDSRDAIGVFCDLSKAFDAFIMIH